MPYSPLRIGALVDVECRSGLGTGGQERITDITLTEIICGAHRYDRATGDSVTEPYAYYIPGLPERGVVGPNDTSVPIFSASTARQIRDRALQDPRGATIGPLLVYVHERIKRAAEEGRSKINHPYMGFAWEWPRPEVQEALWRALILEGYNVQHRPDPDPGLGSGPYTSVSW